MKHARHTTMLLIALASIVLVQNKTVQASPEIEQAVMKVENDMSAALTKPDLAAAEKMLGETYYVVAPDGSTQNKAEFAADLRSGKLKLESNKLEEMKVQFANAEIAVVTYRSTDKGSYDGHDISGQYRWLDVLAKQNGTWQFVTSQGTKIEEHENK